ncbi:hypothetical protein LT330_003335 [Penicillium expansum]|nr:hypothetical protein LT330_003335 [Penicillium expansum]
MPAPAGTAIVLIDPYNDFLHPDGKGTSALTDLDEKDTISHLKKVVMNARLRGVPIYYGLHQQWTPDHYNGWQHMTPSHIRQQEVQMFAEGSFGSQIYEGLEPDSKNGDVVVSRHWCSDSFSGTDLDFQLRQREIKRLVFAGLTANTCLEATARHAYELGYQVTMLKDATAGWSKELTDAATDLIWPLFAQVMTVEDWVNESS